MYTSTPGLGGGAGAAVAGIAVLPNTGGNEVLLVASVLTTLVGAAILLTTIVRMAAKKAYKA